ncbi:elymoclavine monooxygenase [Penicillium macrosclerotiorum]|uniref:elymoclavine monooxygenase n=1 Tax=Penicillium macrosclerotiorum TaxID=303699 RepID=UPI002548F48D|nr:elymoclavine monooxygenase [Penicillium macrosclerotiorum]KAJ5692010.1 elymoclavine monooxygenase [Penicillium macrosclerotiorum]
MFLFPIQSESLVTLILAERIKYLLAIPLLLPIGITIIYRLYAHPLRDIPGPRLAAVSDFYAFYYNYFEDGYTKKIQKFHKLYNSPVVRIGPAHVHVNEPSIFEEIFRMGTRYEKYPAFYKYFGGLEKFIESKDHRTYRRHLASLYSSKSIDTLVPRLLTDLHIVGERLQRSLERKQAVSLERLFRTLATDLILQILLPHDVNMFEFEGYHPFLESYDTVMDKVWLFLTYPLAEKVLRLCPGSENRKYTAAARTLEKYFASWFNEGQQARTSGKSPQRDSHVTRYLEMDTADHQKVRAVNHPLNDIFDFIAGGRDPVTHAMSCAFYYLLKTPSSLSKLQAELSEADSFIRYNFDHKQIQTLPYLSAVVRETLRLSSPIPGCLPRVVPEHGMNMGSIYLPPGTAISVSILAVHQNNKMFPEPEDFLPERWLGDKGKSLGKWNVAFSRGPHQCIGMNLAIFEIYSCIAYLFSRFEFVLANSPDEELQWVDKMIAQNSVDVKVRITKDLWADGI